MVIGGQIAECLAISVSKQFRVYSRNSRAAAVAESARLAPLSGRALL
jgi:hypothetical protein